MTLFLGTKTLSNLEGSLVDHFDGGGGEASKYTNNVKPEILADFRDGRVVQTEFKDPS